MPQRARKPCAYAGCGIPVEHRQRYCDRHRSETWQRQAAKRRADPERRELDAQYWTPAWRSYSKQYLHEHPLCAECRRNERYIRATVVDHIVPTAEGGDFWDPTNHQPLCRPCHGRKSLAETQGRLGRG